MKGFMKLWVVECRNVIREYSIFINSFFLMGSGMSKILIKNAPTKEH